MYTRIIIALVLIHNDLSFLFLGCSNVERFRHDSEPAGQAREALPAADLRYHPVAYEQQVGQGAPAGCRSHLAYRGSHEDLSRGNVAQFNLHISSN